jgi:ATP-dependent protease ClpP protease subunit
MSNSPIIVSGATPQPNQPQSIGEVWVTFFAEINASTAENLVAQMIGLANKRATKVHLVMSTPGGDVRSGMNIFHTLLSLPFPIDTYNVGNVDSIGNVIFLAGQRRYASQNATFMFHGVSFELGAGRLDHKTLVDLLETANADHNRIARIIAEHTQLSERQIRGFFRAQKTKDAAFAKEHGIVHDIKEPKLPSGLTALALIFQR